MLLNYVKLALRNLGRSPSYTLLNTFGLGISIACGILIFMLVRQHLTVDAYHEKADRIALVGTESREETVVRMNIVPYPMSAALRQEYAFLEKTAMVSRRNSSLITITEKGTAPVKFKEEHIRAYAEPELFDIFDFPLLQGSRADFQQPNTALLTEKMARKYYGTTDVLGKTFRLNNQTDFRVVGVLKDIPPNTDLNYEIYCSWSTLKADEGLRPMLDNWGGIQGGTQCFVLFREGHSSAELEQVFGAFREKYFHPYVRSWYYHALPLASVHLDPDYGSGTGKKYLWTLGLIGLLLLLTACVNFVNMATAQALNRAREVGVRKTMGSTQSQLFWKFMTETLLIVGFSTGLGLALARLGWKPLNSLTNLNISFDFGKDPVFYGFLLLLLLTVAFLAGAYPGLVQSRFRPVQSLKGTISTQKVAGMSLRRVLVGSQFAISQVLILGAVVVTAQMTFMRSADLGFRQEGIVTLPMPGDGPANSSFQQEIGRIAGVEAVSLGRQLPASERNWGHGIQLEGRTEDEPWTVNFKFADPQYAEIFELQFIAGRNLQPSDTTREFVVNETVIKKLNLASPEEILGKKLRVNNLQFPVVGVVKDFHNKSFRENIEPLCIATGLDHYDMCAVKINLKNARPILAELEKNWTTAFPEELYEYEFVDSRIAEFYEQEATALQLVRLFAGIAILIGCLGLYGLAAFMVARKTREIGIRKTLGASVPGILWLFGKEYTRLILLAFAIAAPLSWWACTAWLKDYVYHIPLGAWMFGVALAVTFLTAFVTVAIQSAKAALANPVKSLRSE